MLRAELRKLKRSSSWLIALILPLLAVTTGTINFRNNEEVFQRDWTTLASQITLFYGLLFFSMGVGVLAATAWRVEHRGTNWNLLLTTTRRPLELVLAKIAVIAVPVAFMQVVLVAGIFVSGAFVVGLDGVMPADFVLAGGADGGRRAPADRAPVAAVDAAEIVRRTGGDLPVRLRRGGGDRHLGHAPPAEPCAAAGPQHADHQPRLQRGRRLGRRHVRRRGPAPAPGPGARRRAGRRHLPRAQTAVKVRR
ncbi:ABC transporter permease [Nonomuraea salmonea]|uniref:ABC transporter permease n=1 Tax=Nonomuraea salmonea TaxID=46181 RepID=UPI0031E7E0DE